MLYIDSPGEKRTGIKEVKNGITVRDAVERATRKPTAGVGSITVENMSGMHRRISASLKDLVINGVPALQAVASAPVSAPEMSTRKAISAALEFMGAFMWHTGEIHQAVEEEINEAEAAVNSIQQSKLKQNGKNHFTAV